MEQVPFHVWMSIIEFMSGDVESGEQYWNNRRASVQNLFVAVPPFRDLLLKNPYPLGIATQRGDGYVIHSDRLMGILYEREHWDSGYWSRKLYWTPGLAGFQVRLQHFPYSRHWGRAAQIVVRTSTNSAPSYDITSFPRVSELRLKLSAVMEEDARMKELRERLKRPCPWS